MGGTSARRAGLAGAVLLACASCASPAGGPAAASTPPGQAAAAAPAPGGTPATPAPGGTPGTRAPGSSGAAPPAGGFPTPEQLEQLGAVPAPANLFALDVLPVDEWRLQGPFPERVEATPYSEQTPWSALVDDAARRRAGLVVPTEAMYCVARELGRFYLAHRSQPEDGLRRFITSRCNATVARVGFGFVGGPIAPYHDDVQVYGYWRDSVRQNIEEGVSGGPRTVGIWYGRDGDHAVVMIAFGQREVRVEPFSTLPGPDGRIDIRGEALTPVTRLHAVVNRGRYGFAECEQEPGVAPPRFHFHCEPDAADESALIAVSYAPPDRLLSTAALGVLAWPGGTTDEVYRVPRYVDARPVESQQEMAPRFAELLNQVRARAGLAPLELDPIQSAAAEELAPHFFGALLGRSPPVHAELVILGMIAGWGVEGIVESGHFTAAWVVRTRDLGRLLSSALEEPMGREALLAGDIERIAVGALLDDAEGEEAMAAVVGTYSLFSVREHDEYASKIRERLASERTARGRRPPERIDDLVPLCDAAASHVSSGADPRDALRQLLHRSSEVLRRPVSGWIAEVRSLEEIEFPGEYVDRAELDVAVAVAHRKEPGEPWGRYVVMLVVADPAGRGT